ncbi:MAG: hypothetical protein ACLGG0_12885 [Bacteriovoracia bacterium]
MIKIAWNDKFGNQLNEGGSAIYHDDENGDILLTNIRPFSTATELANRLKAYLTVEGTKPDGERISVPTSKVTRQK